MPENYMDDYSRSSYAPPRPIQVRKETETYLRLTGIDSDSGDEADRFVEMVLRQEVEWHAPRETGSSEAETGEFFQTQRETSFSEETDLVDDTVTFDEFANFSEESDSDDDTVMYDEFADEMGELDWYDSGAPTGFSKETIRQHLKTRNFVNIKAENAIDEGLEICVVCQCEYEENEKVGSLVCGHEYHVDCIKKWLSRKTFCPICKAEAFPTQNPCTGNSRITHAEIPVLISLLFLVFGFFCKIFGI